VLGLAWRDVDLDQRVLAVRQTLQYRPDEGFHLVPPKTARSRRIVPLSDAVVDALKLRREQQETDRLAAGVEFWEDWGLVFTTRKRSAGDEVDGVESARGAVSVLPPVWFPGPLAEPVVPISRQRALHGCCRQAGFVGGQGVGIWVPR
jgi:integrase